ncbi:tetratricopeptide repeat protein [Halomonas organivorans]
MSMTRPGDTWRPLARRLAPLLLLALTGCAGVTERLPAMTAFEPREETHVQGPCGERYPAEIGLRIDMIRQQLERGRPRAALAHLEEGGFDRAETTLMRGDALRAIGRHDDADAVYETLATGCLAGEAYHGMARNAVARGDREEAILLMQEARRARPTDPDIRNDLGYLLILQGRRQAAREELLTALELGGARRRAASNLVMLLMQEGETLEAQRLAERYGVDGELVERLRRLARAGSNDNG